MAIIIGDIHGDVEKVKAFLTYEPELEHVALGDFVDNIKSGVTLNDELTCLDMLLSSNTVLLWGNHDICYTPQRPWRSMSGHSLTIEEVKCFAAYSDYLRELYVENGDLSVRDVFTDRFRPHIDRMKAAYAADGWLCTHAGVSPGVAAIIPADILAAGSSDIAEWLNEEFKREFQVQTYMTSEGPKRYGYGPLFQIDISRGGLDDFGGIFWFDPKREMTDPGPLVGRQIFGHTRVPTPEIGPHWVNMNNYEEGIWVYDTLKNCLIDLG